MPKISVIEMDVVASDGFAAPQVRILITSVRSPVVSAVGDGSSFVLLQRAGITRIEGIRIQASGSESEATPIIHAPVVAEIIHFVLPADWFISIDIGAVPNLFPGKQHGKDCLLPVRL